MVTVVTLWFSIKSWLFSSFHVCVSFLCQVESPVRHVEESEDGREDHSGQHVDLLRPAGELVEPGLQEVLPLPGLHVDLALVDVVDVGEVGAGRRAHPAGGARAAAHHGLHGEGTPIM